MRTIRPSLLAKQLRINARADIPTMIWGPPGIGKSAIVYQLAESMNAKLFELRANLFDPVDVRGGLKVVEQQDGTYRTRYGVPEDYPDTNYTGPVVLLIDELPNAPKATQNALLQLILNKKIGTYELPQGAFIVAAGNRSIDRAAVHEMPTPVKTRFAHFELESNIDDFCAWAIQNNIDPTIISFVRYRPTLQNSLDSRENAMPTSRGWEMADRALKLVTNASADEQFYAIASIVGDGPAGEFIAFKQQADKMPDLDRILATPSAVEVPSDPAVLFAVSSALASRADQNSFKNIMAYAKRMPAEYQVVLVRDSLAKDRELTQTPAFQQWTQDNASVLM